MWLIYKSGQWELLFDRVQEYEITYISFQTDYLMYVGTYNYKLVPFIVGTTTLSLIKLATLVTFMVWSWVYKFKYI